MAEQFADVPDDFWSLSDYESDGSSFEECDRLLDDGLWLSLNHCEGIVDVLRSGRAAESRRHYLDNVSTALLTDGWRCVENVREKLDDCCTGCILAKKYGVGTTDVVLCTGVLVRFKVIGTVVVACGYHDFSLYSRGRYNGCSGDCCRSFYRGLDSIYLSEYLNETFGKLPFYRLSRGRSLVLGTKPWCRQA